MDSAGGKPPVIPRSSTKIILGCAATARRDIFMTSGALGALSDPAARRQQERVIRARNSFLQNSTKIQFLPLGGATADLSSSSIPRLL